MSTPTFWLSREGLPAEGPFDVNQLTRMYESGSVSANAMVCREGRRDWTPLADVLPRPPASSSNGTDWQHAMSSRDNEHADSINRVINWVTAAICLIGIVPFLGLSAYLIWGFWTIIATILCVILFTKGRAADGVRNLIAVWILAPLLIGGLQFLVIAFLAGVASDRREKEQMKAAYVQPQAQVEEVPQVMAPEPVQTTATVEEQPPAANPDDLPYYTEAVRHLMTHTDYTGINTVRSEMTPTGRTVWIDFNSGKGPQVWRFHFDGKRIKSIYNDATGDLQPN